MAPLAQRLSMLMLLAAVLAAAAPAVAQAPPQGPAGSAQPAVRRSQQRLTLWQQPEEAVETPTADGEEPTILRSLPRPPDQPRSLFEQEPGLGMPPVDWEHPYFERDPLLDPTDWPSPGWFSQVDLGAVQAHVSNPMAGFVPTSQGPIAVQLGSARLNWAVAPRVELGYRLPSGFGEFSVSERYFNTLGSDTILVPGGPASRRSEFMLNYTDVDYGSRELTPNPGWGLKFRGGIRASQTFFGSRVDAPLAAASSFGGAFALRETNRDTSVGPHFGVEVERKLARRGLSVLGNVDVAEMFSHVRQDYFAATIAPTGGVASGTSVSHFIQEIPVLTAQLGVSWRSARFPNSRFYIGYFGQFWYKFATNSNVPTGPFGVPIETHFDNQGIILQWSLNL